MQKCYVDATSRDSRDEARNERTRKDSNLMNASSDRTSSNIYQFPLRGRFAQSEPAETKPAAQALPARAFKAVIGGAWYHEQAILDAERAHKN